jgi:hypothetical protein
MNYTTLDDTRVASRVLQLTHAEFPDVLVEHIEAHHGNDCHLFEFTLRGRSVREEFSTELIADEDRTSDLLNRIGRAVRRIGEKAAR